MDTKQRNSSFELLRIITMLIIICHHFADHAGFDYVPTMISAPRYCFNLLWMGGKVGVNVFVLISGYFLVAEKDQSVFNLRKLIKLWSQMFFYGILIFAVFSVLREDNGGLLAAVMPLTRNTWWFATVYFVLFLFHPFLNRLLRALDKETYKKMLIVALVLWSIVSFMMQADYYLSDLIWFMIPYAVAGYIRLHGLNPKLKRKHFIIGFVVSALIVYLHTTSIMYRAQTNSALFNSFRWLCFRQNLPAVFLESVCLFMIFEKTEMKYNKWINRIASTTFGIYLIHDSYPVRNVLWTRIFHVADFKNSMLILPYGLLAMVLIFVTCALIDLLRQFLEKYWMKLVDKCLPGLKKAFGWVYKVLGKVMG